MVSGVWLLVGKDAHLKETFIRELKRTFFPKDAVSTTDYQAFDADRDPLSAALDFVRTTPFLSARRLAVLSSVDKLTEEEKRLLFEEVGRLPATAGLVLVSEEGSAKKDGFLKDLSQKVKTVPCYPPFEKNLPSWVETRAKGLGKTIDRRAVFLLIEQVGRETAALDAALEELSLYVHPRTNFTAEDVQALLGRSVSADVFRLCGLILDGSARDAFWLLSDLLREGTRVHEIVGALTTQAERLRKAVALLGQGLGARDIGLQLGINPYHLEPFVQQASKTSKAKVDRLLSRLALCDESIKTGKLGDRLAIERFALEMF